jgi:hypothetical protein
MTTRITIAGAMSSSMLSFGAFMRTDRQLRDAASVRRRVTGITGLVILVTLSVRDAVLLAVARCALVRQEPHLWGWDGCRRRPGSRRRRSQQWGVRSKWR